jgi:O-antigen/teichoic acid export membrane protein
MSRPGVQSPTDRAGTILSASEPPPADPCGQSTLLAIGQVAGASIASRFLRVVKVLVVARLLSPESYGVFGALAVLINYAQFLELGSSTAAFRDLTAAVGRGDAREAWRASGRMGTLKLAAAALFGGGALVASFWPGVPGPLRQGLVALPAMALSSTLLSQVLLHLQAHGRAAEYSRVTALAAAADLALCVGLTAVWSLPGLLAASALSPLLALVWAARRRALAPLRAVPPPVLGQYLRTGIPLAALALLDLSLLSVDQLVVMTFLSLRDLGLYSIAFALPEGVRTLGAAAAAVLGPRLLREHARSGASLAAIRRHTLQPVLLYANVLPLVIGLLWIGGGYALVRFYPAYAGALRPMQILLVAGDFLVVLGGVTTFLFAIDKHPRNLLILTPAVCLNVAIDLLLLRLGFRLEAIAVGSLVAYFGYACALLWYVSGHFDMGRAARLEFLAGALLPGIGLGLAMSLLERFVAYRDSLAATAGVAALVALSCAPLAWRGLGLARRLDDPEP